MAHFGRILPLVAVCSLIAALSIPAFAGDEVRDPVKQKRLEKHYLGKHKLGVNRVNDGKRNGPAKIIKEEQALVLEGKVEKGKYWLEIRGVVHPTSKKEFFLDGEVKGVPNLEWRNEGPKERTTKGRFTFRATKGRKFWRLYEVDGTECVCNDGCGNEFCYIDLSFR